jgi:hypothetical protein
MVASLHFSQLSAAVRKTAFTWLRLVGALDVLFKQPPRAEPAHVISTVAGTSATLLTRLATKPGERKAGWRRTAFSACAGASYRFLLGFFE